MAGSLATGRVAALLLAGAPFVPAQERAVTGAVRCGFALGWAMLAVLSVRFTEQPQRWRWLLPWLWGGRPAPGWGWRPGGPGAQLGLAPALLALAVWMLVRVHRQLPSRLGRWPPYPVIAVLALASIGGGYQTLGAAADAKASPMPGQLLDVGGHRLHRRCTGSGTPTAVLEPAAGEMSSNLGWLTPAVARDTRVCVYDRAGRGGSEPASSAQDGTQIATDLHRLLQRGQVPGPYALAGHSFAGHRVITDVTHEALVANQDGAAATTQAILDVVASVRSPRRLAR